MKVAVFLLTSHNRCRRPRPPGLQCRQQVLSPAVFAHVARHDMMFNTVIPGYQAGALSRLSAAVDSLGVESWRLSGGRPWVSQCPPGRLCTRRQPPGNRTLLEVLKYKPLLADESARVKEEDYGIFGGIEVEPVTDDCCLEGNMFSA